MTFHGALPVVPDQVIGGKYRLIAPIGQGAMGSVWRAERLDWAAPVALKLMLPELCQLPEYLARFEREVRLAAGLRSPHVVQVLDHGFDAACQCGFIAMELLEGEALSRRLRRMARFSPAETLQILTHVIRAMSRAHAVGIVHRDLKPDNLFIVNDDGEDLTKVLDFGVAKWSVPRLGDALTRPGSILGTPLYMSPEQIRGLSDIDHRADLWSLTVIACECLTGKRPFDGQDFGALAVLLLDPARRPTPSSLGPVPPGFDAWFARGTHPDISRRFQSARELLEELAPLCATRGAPRAQPGERAPPAELALAETPSTWRAQWLTVSRRTPRREWIAPALVAAALVVGAGVFVLSVQHQRGTRAAAGSQEPLAPLLEPHESAPIETVVRLRQAAPVTSTGLGEQPLPSARPSLVPGTAQVRVIPSTAGESRPAEPSASAAKPEAEHRRSKTVVARRPRQPSPPAAEPVLKTEPERVEVNGRAIRTTLQ